MRGFRKIVNFEQTPTAERRPKNLKKYKNRFTKVQSLFEFDRGQPKQKDEWMNG